MTDDALIEAMARAMFKDDQVNRLDIAKAALTVCRPIIEAQERERCYLASVSTTCSVEETADYYSGYCDGVQDAAAALKETGDE